MFRRSCWEMRRRNASLPNDFGVIYTGLGDNNRALEWFDKAYAEHSGFMVYAYLDPRLKSLRHESRFHDLLHRVLTLLSQGRNRAEGSELKSDG